MSEWISEDEIERARADAGFRQQLMAKNLDRLLAALNKMRRQNTPSPEKARQLREGADLAVKLADRLQNGAA